MKRKSKNQLLTEFKKIHGDKYDYSNVNYINTNTPVDIICRTHGVFEQLPKSHLRGLGCDECGIIQRHITNTKTTKEFINEANKIHCYKYDYSKTKYIKNDVELIITCKIHGDFTQKPTSHLYSKCGCQRCAKSGYDNSKGGFLYYIHFENNEYEFYKIGITNNSVNNRLQYFKLRQQIKPNVKFAIWFDDGKIPQRLESVILNTYNKFYFENAKEFIKSGYTETFSCNVLEHIFTSVNKKQLLLNQFWNNQ